MPMYNLIEYGNNYSKTSGYLWQHYRDEVDDTAMIHYESFKSKVRKTESMPGAVNTKDVKIAVPL